MPPEHDDKASTSNDSDIEQNEYDRRRENYWAKIIFCERKFNELKPILLKERMNQLEKRQDDLLNRRAKDYLQKKTTIDEEFYHKREINDSFYRLRNESLQRRVKGEQFCAKSNFKNNKKLITDMIRDTFEKKMEDLLEEKSKSEELFSRYAKKVKTPVEDLSTSSESEHEIPEWIRKEEVRVTKYLQKKKRKIRQPCLIYSLPYSILQQDIKKINKSLLDANVNI